MKTKEVSEKKVTGGTVTIQVRFPVAVARRFSAWCKASGLPISSGVRMACIHEMEGRA
jgi:hypothetical protein